MNNIQRRILASLIVVVSILAIGILANRYASLELLVAQESQLRASVRANPIRAWILGFVAYTSLALIPGTSGKSVVFGWLYGFWTAVLMVNFSLTTAALITFYVSRYLFREAIEGRFGVQLGYFRKKLQSNGGFYLLTIRLLHAPFSFVNYGSGATNIVPASTFWWTTQLGMLPGTMIFVFAGTRIPTLSVIAQRGAIALLDWTMIAAFIGTGIVPVLIRGIFRLVRRWGKRRHDDCGQEESVAVAQDLKGSEF
ncbi:MAG TPA: VTT domain-containing protein [Planctomycetaceae bacterium]|nr:VTT domain-containing protein [Planctomycetaceae bacterium]